MQRPLNIRRLLILFAAIAMLTSGCSLFSFGANDKGQIGVGHQVGQTAAYDNPTAVATDTPFTKLAPDLRGPSRLGWRDDRHC